MHVTPACNKPLLAAATILAISRQASYVNSQPVGTKEKQSRKCVEKSSRKNLFAKSQSQSQKSPESVAEKCCRGLQTSQREKVSNKTVSVSCSRGKLSSCGFVSCHFRTELVSPEKAAVKSTKVSEPKSAKSKHKSQTGDSHSGLQVTVGKWSNGKFVGVAANGLRLCEVADF